MKLPGGAWTALILLLVGLLQGWLQDWFTAPWVPLAVLALSLIAKAIEVKVVKPLILPIRGMRVVEQPAPSALRQLLLG